METIYYKDIYKLDYWFKSYYVVWKLKCKKNNKTAKQSLNRTMQYGNRKKRKRHRKIKKV